MDYSMIALGLGAGTIFAGITMLLYRITRFMDDDAETALAKLFLKPEAIRGFKLLAFSNMILTVPLVVESVSLVQGYPEIAATARYVMPLPMLGYMYFYVQIYDVTKPNN